ncbi:hypothetical protein PtrSN002B_009110 [Pyrenophora tritici-repentis]|uniref:Med15 multi-domain protein n=1 Tax=Pyrenophora tritici-repentis TaxID=45151 RepID=A0A2W1FQI2_9PLEO|nr:hypothetical protein PtrV1_13945 [Pyrenophora tritici-repentis]KAF7442109.1 hypothetical protein A1F99_129780 [Pyrenophora tritici-repentis]KAF7579528.1 Med15 multi-domain protein [Pyrenophora tritici-repentis]KAG9378431.1 hypothetical protein A1F94_011547 [Pyrenophora tritici-repentis]KAI0573012.1 hypothetical protein Alg215_09440 [Pyrenophora tritici-repentis]
MSHVDPLGHSAGLDSQQSTPVTPASFFDSDNEPDSDKVSYATTVPETVMAEQVAKDVVKEAQSVGPSAPIDDSASTTNSPAVNGGSPSDTATKTPNDPEASSTKQTANGANVPSIASVNVDGQAAAGDNKQSGASQADSKQPHLNGISSDHLATDSLAVTDASGGSDTDISRPGSVDQSKRDGSHVRTSSAAKKQPFKSVSVTKSFLAKTVTTTPAARPGEKVTAAAPPKPSNVLSAKPRLVAKSGTSNAPRTLGQTNGAGAGPDASKVWNKNQPVPPPPPKQFTDEELKQQYGIHLATRLQADEGGKEAKWADIDDDEDDWAPETVQWMDGTKSSVAVPPEQPPPPEEPKTILKPETPAETPKPKPEPAPVSTSNPKPSVTGGTKTILKPGAHAQPCTGKSSLVLKGQPEKPTLVAKPSATEKKSPWAPLPPIEKVSPVQINPPAHQPPPQRYSQRDSYGYDSMPPPPAKEIAPDDFNRSWRNDSGGRDGRDGRELFNSQSGRYEPVHNDVRRGSGRDSGFRQQPAVLQRPSQDGPAEPSAAFQTSRATADGPTWGRRRNSSNVSGGMPRRMSMDPRADMPNGPMNSERRESHSINGFDPSDSTAARQSPFQQMKSPNMPHAHPASPYGSAASPAVQQAQAVAPVAPPAEDPVVVQNRLMAEKIERARLKKLQDAEAEKRAEEEKKERIAKKLAAMGPPKAKEQSPARPAKSPPKEKAVPASVQSPPKPPVPTADGEVAQYGMMKVHQPHPVKKSPQMEHARVSASAQAAASLDQQTQPFDPLARDSEKSRLPTEQSNPLAHQTEGTSQSGTRPQGPAAWTPSTAPQPKPWTSQVWGPPQAKDRALGNGTFGSSYRGPIQPGAQQQLPVQAPAATAPIGTGLAQQPIAPQPARQMPPQQMFSQRPARAQQPQSRTYRKVEPISGGGWDKFGDFIKKDDQDTYTKNRQDQARQGEAFRPEIRETFKDQRGQAEVTLHDKVAAELALAESLKKDEVTKPLQEGLSPQQVIGQGTLQQATGTRPSRFFPRPMEPAPPMPAFSSNKADSPPPPPETETHPAFSSETNHPMVRLPKPSPVVRLPPSAVGNVASAPATMPRGQGLGARPLTMNPEWQARFNKLLDKPGSTRPSSLPATSPVFPVVSPQQGAVAPTALSKAALDVRGNAGTATVSLPTAPLGKTFADDRGKDVVTRKGAEALFEDREFGSLPTVKLSKAPHLAANQAPKPAPRDEQHPKYKKFENPFTIRRLEAFDIEKNAQNKGKFDVVVSLPNMRNPVTKSVQRKHYGPKINRQSKPKQPGSPSSTSVNGSKERPRKPSHQGSADRPYNNTARPSAAKSWTTNSNPRSSAISSANTANAVSTPTTWAKLAAA